MTTKAVTLFDIEAAKKRVEEALEVEGGDVSEGTEGAVLAERLEKLEMTERQKVDAIGWIWAEIDASIAAMEATRETLVKPLQDRIRVFTNRRERLKDGIKYVFGHWGLLKVEGHTKTIYIQKNGGKPALKLKVGIDQLPEKFKRTVTEVVADTDAIRKAVEAGDPDALHIAEMGDVGTSVRIK
jgi:hypothetical protein